MVAGSELHEDPFRPITHASRMRIESEGDNRRGSTGSSRDQRYGEKLATPDITIADTSRRGTTIKVAEGRYLSDEMTIHYGLIPLTNRGIFCIQRTAGSSPSASRWGLLNIMGRATTCGIRGYRIQMPLDVLVVASANPEDCTNRGPHHHAAEGLLRRPDPHALPAQRRA